MKSRKQFGNTLTDMNMKLEFSFIINGSQKHKCIAKMNDDYVWDWDWVFEANDVHRIDSGSFEFEPPVLAIKPLIGDITKKLGEEIQKNLDK